MWTVAHYQPTSMFSLRPALSTASGAQSLLVPTPFAVKMALVNAAFQLASLERVQAWWPTIRDLSVAYLLPDAVVVNKTFIKIQRRTDLSKQKGVDKDQYVNDKINDGRWPFQPTIAYREFVLFDGMLGIALEHTDHSDIPFDQLLSHIHYLGKRGSFMQLQALPHICEELDSAWVNVTEPLTSFPARGTLQVLDDCGSALTWAHVDVYSGKSIKLNADQRVLRSIVLPYQQRRSSYRYTLYERIK
jgi:hypothetical protein